nr:MAG TPA: hypothetical protein [Caudoviricetes sp.]
MSSAVTMTVTKPTLTRLQKRNSNVAALNTGPPEAA